MRVRLPHTQYHPTPSTVSLMTRMPAVPKEIFSVLGPLPVTLSATLSDGQTEEVYGLFDQVQRTVQLSKGSCVETQWGTYFHEMVHVALWDSGVTDSLDHAAEEGVCNAIGTYLAAAVRAGHIKVTSRRKV